MVKTNSAYEIILKYEGPDVDNGSMQIENVISALSGFSNSYKKIASLKRIEENHQLRIVDLKHDSFDIVINAIQFLSVNRNEIIEVTKTIAPIVKLILEFIKFKKHVQGKTYKTEINENTGTVNVINIDKVSISITPEILEVVSQKMLDHDLQKIVAPIQKEFINSATLLIKDEKNKVIEEKITDLEKSYFDVDSVETTTTKETTLIGTINSLTKTTKNGKFILPDGQSIPFHLSMENAEYYYKYFAHSGTLRVKCIAHLDESLKPIKLEISEIEEIQQNLFTKK